MKTILALASAIVLFGSVASATETLQIPPGEAQARERLNASPRHGEWADIEVPGTTSTLRAWVSFPERTDKAPVVIVIFEIYGLSDWIRSVTDQLAADGFIAIAPDLLSGSGKDGGGTDSFADRDAVVAGVRGLKPEAVTRALNAVRDYGKKLPSSNGKTATVGYCWGGTTSFRYATEQADLNGAVVYYGSSPDAPALEKLKVSVSGHYGANDNRVNSTIEPAKAKLKELGAAAEKLYTPHIYDGAGHGFLRQQDGQNGANKKAADQAWPETIRFLREQTGDAKKP